MKRLAFTDCGCRNPEPGTALDLRPYARHAVLQGGGNGWIEVKLAGGVQRRW
jgi:hypothetical protein